VSVVRGRKPSVMTNDHMNAGYTSSSIRLSTRLSVIYRMGQKTGLFLRVDNFASANGRNVCDTAKVTEFCLEKCKRTSMLVHVNILCLIFILFTVREIMLNLPKIMNFTQFLTAPHAAKSCVSNLKSIGCACYCYK